MVGGEREGGAVTAPAVRTGVAVLAYGTGTLIVAGLETFFKAFGDLKPSL